MCHNKRFAPTSPGKDPTVHSQLAQAMVQPEDEPLIITGHKNLK